MLMRGELAFEDLLHQRLEWRKDSEYQGLSLSRASCLRRTSHRAALPVPLCLLCLQSESAYERSPLDRIVGSNFCEILLLVPQSYTANVE